MNRTNPIAATVQPIAGRRLPPGWKPEITTRVYDQRDLENLWRSPQWSAKQHNQDNIQQAARLAPPTWSEMFGER